MASRGFYLCVQRIQFKESSVARLPPPPGAQFHRIAPPKSSFNRSEPQHPLRQSETHPGLIVISHPRNPNHTAMEKVELEDVQSWLKLRGKEVVGSPSNDIAF